MTRINPQAAAAREGARQQSGRFGEQGHPDPGQISLAGPGDPAEPELLVDVLEPGDEIVVPVSEHGDETLGEVTVRRRYGHGVAYTGGAVYAQGGPSVPIHEAVPDGADPDEYLDRWGGLVTERAAASYQGLAGSTGDPDEPRIEFVVDLPDDATTDTVTGALRSHPGLARLQADLRPGPDGQTRFVRNLRDHLPEDDLPDMSDDPDVLEALGEGPELTANQRYMLNVLLDTRNDPAGRRRTAGDALDGFEYFNGEGPGDWGTAAGPLREHARRRGVAGGFEFDVARDDEGIADGYTVSVYHWGMRTHITSYEDGKYLHRGGYEGLRGAVEAAEVIESDWVGLRNRLDREMPSWRERADR